MKDGPHDLPNSGGKHKLGEKESQMPHRNMRGPLNGSAGSHDNPTKDTTRGYTEGNFFGPGIGPDNMKINKSHSGKY